MKLLWITNILVVAYFGLCQGERYVQVRALVPLSALSALKQNPACQYDCEPNTAPSQPCKCDSCSSSSSMEDFLKMFQLAAMISKLQNPEKETKPCKDSSDELIDKLIRAIVFSTTQNSKLASGSSSGKDLINLALGDTDVSVNTGSSGGNGGLLGNLLGALL